MGIAGREAGCGVVSEPSHTPGYLDQNCCLRRHACPYRTYDSALNPPCCPRQDLTFACAVPRTRHTPPAQHPVTLVPCGHTFCRQCLAAANGLCTECGSDTPAATTIVNAPLDAVCAKYELKRSALNSIQRALGAAQQTGDGAAGKGGAAGGGAAAARAIGGLTLAPGRGGQRP